VTSTAAALLDAGAAATAAGSHGQMAQALGPRGIVVSCAKTLEDGVRAQMLVVPGLLRFDVSPRGDTLRVIVRPLGPHPLVWRADDPPWSLTPAGRYEHVREINPTSHAFHLTAQIGPERIEARIVMACTLAPEPLHKRVVVQGIFTRDFAHRWPATAVRVSAPRRRSPT
jgi:hypothetical protein